MAAIDASIYEDITIESGDGSRTVDLKLGVVALRYFENLFSPTITVEITVTNTGGAVKGKDGSLQSVYSGLPLRGGERVFIKIAGNSNTNKGIDLSDEPLYVSKIANVIREGQRESFTLKLVSRESITNETSRVYKKFKRAPVTDHAKTIVKESLLSEKTLNSDDAINQYGFIGNLKRPFDVLTMLASKSVADTGVPGYFFYETIDGYNFRSIDKLIVEGKASPKAEYYHQEDQNYKKSTDDRILSYAVTRNNDLLEKLRMGTYASFLAQFDPYESKFSRLIEGKRTIKDFAEKATFLGDEPDVPQLFGANGAGFDNIPSRIFSSVLDIGVMEKDVSKAPGNDAKNYQRDALFRYNYLFMQTLEMTVPLNTTLSVGNVIRCNFLKVSSNNKEFDRENSGLYMIKELCHHFDGTQSLTSMKLLRDTFGDV
jgi:hypothetical protein